MKGSHAEEFPVFESEHLPNWCIIPSGALPPNPSELLSSNRMKRVLDKLAEKYDYIIVDLPPVNLVSDALAISEYITGMILVIREDYAEKKEVENCVRQLQLSNVNVLGCVMNESKFGASKYRRYRYKNYYKYK